MEKSNTRHMFSNRDLRIILVPLVIEQILNSLMGTADTMMVSNVGSSAISAVALVDSINVLVIQVFTALAAGGTIVCSQYMGQRDIKNAEKTAGQLIFIMTVIALGITLICTVFQYPILRGIFGSVEESVMRDSRIYFFYTALSFPFIAVFNAGSSIFRAQENTRLPMVISVISNLINIAGNAVLIFGLHMGVTGAAAATLCSRIFCAVTVMWFLHRPGQEITVRDYRNIRPEKNRIKTILRVGIPTGIENGMFQFGKLAIQSTVSTLGTTAIAAQAMASMLENMNGMAGLGVGIGLMTIAGECIGAGREDEAIYYTKKLTCIAEVVIIVSCTLVYLLLRPITVLGGMEPESARLCIYIVTVITLVKPVIWIFSFIPPYAMKAAGDVKYSMLVSCISMWLCRVSLSTFLCRVMGVGLIAVWIGMFSDWGIRGIAYTIRFRSRKWLEHKVI